MLYEEFTELLRKEVVPALGCTGPTAYALAAACCKPYLTGKLQKVDVYVSPAFLKIGFGVATPGTSEPGIKIAAAIGLVGGDHTLGLRVLQPVTPQDVAQADALVAQGIFHVLCAWEESGVYVRVEAATDKETVLAEVKHRHDGIARIEVDGVSKFQAHVEAEGAEDDPQSLVLEEIFDYVRNVDPNDLQFLLDGYQLDLAIAEDGLKNPFGLQSGRAQLIEYWRGKKTAEDVLRSPMAHLPGTLAERAQILVSAASDARMGGSRLPATATMGDGNQGLTAILPVGAAAELYGADREHTLRALALSCLLLFYVKMHIGRAAAFCLCAIAASGGVAGGVAYLRGMDEKHIEAAVKNVIAPLAGMLCDGAKNGCAVKMAIAASTALNAVNLAAADVEVGYFDGVADDTLKDTVTCISHVATQSMALLDRCMTEEILQKEARGRQGKS